MAENTDVRIVVNVSGADDSADKLKRADDALRQFESQSGGAGDGLTKLGAAFTGLNQGLELFQKGFSLVSGAFSNFIGIIERGDAVGDVAESFQSLTKATGETASVFLNQLNAATGDAISNFNLQKQAIEGLRAGAKPDEIIALAEAARVLGEQGGDTAQDFDALSKAFETGRIAALQNKLGIIDTDKAQQELAETLGVTVDLLTDEAKVLANRQALIDAAKQRTAEFGLITKGTADNIKTFNKLYQDTLDKFALSISTNQKVAELFNQIGEAINAIDWDVYITGATRLIEITINAVQYLEKFGDALNQINPITLTQSIGEKLVGALSGASTEIDRINKLLEQKTPEALRAATDSFNKLIAGENKLSETTKKALTPALAALYKELQKQQDKLGAAKRANDELKKTSEGLTGTTEKLSVVFEEQAKTLKDKLIRAEIESAQVKRDAIKASEERAAAEREILDDMVAAQEERVASEREIARQQEEIQRQSLDSLKQTAAEAGEALNSLLEGDTAAFGQQLGTFLTQNVASAIDSLVPGLGSFLGPLIEKPLQKVSKKLGDFISNVFGGGDSAGTKARKAVDGFFRDAFEAQRLGIIINEQLVALDSLVFKGDTLFGGTIQYADDAFKKFFESLPPLAQAAFGGVGRAFEGLTGVADAWADHLGALIANNIGGDLNNLQLLVKASGKSFEDLAGVIEQAFLRGELSANQAAQALLGIQTIAEDGIPGALGAVDEAFQNLIAAGKTGGATLIDALQDVGFEARELGIKDFAALEAEINRRIPGAEDTIRQLFQALQSTGIQSIEQLTSATVQQLIPALGQLEAVNFPFAEEAKNIRDLIEQVNSIPSNIEKNLTFNIRSNVDSNTRALAERGVFNTAGVGQAPGFI